MNLSDYVCVYDNALDVDYCRQLIEQFESDVREQLKQQDSIKSFTEINAVQAGWDLRPLLQQALTYRQQYWRDCRITAQHVNPDHAWEEIRMKRYRANTADEFRPHTDSWNAETARRFLVYFWYLQDVEAGGETEFYGLDRPLKIQPRAGRLVMFPATWQYLHAGLPVQAGTKYIIGGYYQHG